MEIITMLCMWRCITGVRILGDCVDYGTASILKSVAAPAVAAAAEVGGCS